MIITIDGPAGTGKSTVARRLAALLDMIYINTGILYRTVAWILWEKNLLPHPSSQELKSIFDHFDFHIHHEGESQTYFLNGEEISRVIFTPHISEVVSEISALKEVRDALTPFQLAYAQQGNSILEGRDLATLFPWADYKFFLTAREEVRAERRYREIQKQWAEDRSPPSLEGIRNNLKKRDYIDSTRVHSPLTQTQDAIVVDTSDLSIDQVVEIMQEYCKR